MADHQEIFCYLFLEQDICFFYMCPGTTHKVVGCTVPRRDSSRWLIVNYLR